MTQTEKQFIRLCKRNMKTIFILIKTNFFNEKRSKLVCHFDSEGLEEVERGKKILWKKKKGTLDKKIT